MLVLQHFAIMALVSPFIAKSWLRLVQYAYLQLWERDDSQRSWVRRLAGAMRRYLDELAVRRKTDPTPTTLNWRSHMTLMKSIMLGSAAGIVAVASAQAADLPTESGAGRVC